MKVVRYVYGVAAAVLLGGSAYSMTGGELVGQEAQNQPRPVPIAGAPESFADLAARLQPAVVNISTRQRIAVRQRSGDPFEQFFRQFGRPGPQQDDEGNTRTRETGSLGSGFIISPDGYVVTNNHLIESRDGGSGTVDEVVVTLTDGEEYEARIVGRDRESDLAVLKIEGNNLPYVNWGDSDDVRVGDWVIAIGNPFGFDGTVTAGIVSAIQRGIPQGGVGTQFQRFIQTDASINMGNSGGPMFDMAGNVVGINSALYSPTGANVGIGLAIPAQAARPVIESLRSGEVVQRGYLGVGLQPIDDDFADALGLPRDRGELVREVVAGQAAARAGIQQGDVIIGIGGTEVDNDNTVSYLIANTPVGRSVPVDLIRDGERRRVNITVSQRPSIEEMARQQGMMGQDDSGMAEEDDEAVATGGGSALGMNFQPLNDRIRRQFNIDSNVQGVIISRVDPNGPAAERGLRRLDVIVSANRQRVSSAADVENAIEAARRAGRSNIIMLVKRGNQPEAFLTVELD